MKHYIYTIFLFFIFCFECYSQEKQISIIDSALIKRISISGFCLCKTTISDLKLLDDSLKEVYVEDIDLPKECFRNSSRNNNDIGFYSEKYPGLIFQKEEDSDFINKIRITKDFKGYLPNGHYIDMSILKLSDVFQIFPEFVDKWGSRDCSNHWDFSNDTIKFFVKIDKSIKPQFPINKEYYINKPVEAIDFAISCYSIYHKTSKRMDFSKNEPIIYLDMIRVNTGVLNLYDPNEIAAVEVIKDSNAIKLIGEDGKNGLIYVTTKEYARDKYLAFFKSKSDEYNKIFSSLKDEKNIIYILNGKILEKNYEGDLFYINDSNFIDLKVINKETLKSDYNIRGKKWGVVITSLKNK